MIDTVDGPIEPKTFAYKDEGRGSKGLDDFMVGRNSWISSRVTGINESIIDGNGKLAGAA